VPFAEVKRVQIKKTHCDICSFGCRMDAYVENGRLQRVAPDMDSPTSRRFLCAKGYATRQYVYHQDRVLTPLKRVGPRGAGQFVPISWDEALDLVAAHLNQIKARDGADAVAFYSGYTKWYRWLLHRLAHSFGTLNYGTESSACFQATVVANKCSSGTMHGSLLDKAGAVLAWGSNSYYSNLPGPSLEAAKAHGAKIVLVDPKLTPASQMLADVHLRPMPGTDGALAHGFARYFIDHEFLDRDFLDRWVEGYDDYAAYVRQFDPATVEHLTGVPQADFEKAAQLLVEHGPLCVQEGNAAMIHHRNGVQNYRAVNALVAITGGYRTVSPPFSAVDPNKSKIFLEGEFLDETRPQNARPKIGSQRWPVWSWAIDEFQAMDLARNLTEGTPYPIRGLFAAGLNCRMFPDNGKLFAALEQLDFFVDVDIFLTDTARYADVILPACTSLERRQLVSAGRSAYWLEPAIAPLGESRSDADIFCQVADRLGLDDPVLRGGYEACCRHIMRELPYTLEDLQREHEIALPAAPPAPLRFYTPSGKYELRSSVLEANGFPGLPVYTDPLEGDDPSLPFVMCAGGRLPGCFASRFHRVDWTREALRPEAAVDIHPDDAARLGIGQGDRVTVWTQVGQITLAANVTYVCLPGVLHLYHGYSEADVNAILPDVHDPISGYPPFRSFRCGVRKADV
jgi:anaerobic selenocysteine-containing dehydrogenase